MLVSFLGTLPLGTLNVAAMQISAQDGISPALKFALGSLLVEAIYVRISLVAMDWIRKQRGLFKILEWVTLLIVLALATSSFYAAMHPEVKKNVILSSAVHRFFLGMMMCAVSPAQIPFWFGWSTVLFTKKILLPKASFYNMYIFGIALGTFAGNCIFIFGGRLMVDTLNTKQSLMHWIIGSIFAVTALVQVWKMIKNKDAVHSIEHPEELTERFGKQIKDED